jgi:hypothetical protein
MIGRVSALPPLSDLPGCGSFAYIEAGGCKDVKLPETGLPAQIVWLAGWPLADKRGVSPEPEAFTIARCAVPELIGRIGSFVAGPEAEDDGTMRVIANMAAPRDLLFIQALVDEELESVMLRAPLGLVAPGHVRDVAAEESLCLIYETGNLVARVRGEERGSEALGQLVAILDAAIARAAELSPPPDELNAHVELDERHEIEAGAMSLEDARRRLRDRMPRRFGLREQPDDALVARAFAQSYAEAWNYRAEELSHATVELPRYGVEGDPVISVVGTLPDGRPVRMAHTTGWVSLPRTSERRAPVRRDSYDVAVTRVSDDERFSLEARLQRPQAGEPGAWLAGEMLIVVRPAQPGAVTAMGLDAVRDEVAMYLDRSHVTSLKSA